MTSHKTPQTKGVPQKSGLKTDRSLITLSSKCVSQICTCGLHKCPKLHEVSMNATTTNQDFYRPYKINRTEATDVYQKKPSTHYNPQALQTTYDAQFTKKKAPIPDPDENIQNKISEQRPKFHGQTEYNAKYLRTNIKVQTQVEQRLSYTPKKPTKFKGETQYERQFYKKQVKVDDTPYDKYEYKPAKQHKVFNGTSTYDQQYKPYKIKTQQSESSPYTHPDKIPFKATTQYDNVYRRYPNLAYSQQKRCPIEELPPYPSKLSAGQKHIKYSYKKNTWK